MRMKAREDAEVAYTAYRDYTGGVSLASGQRIPEWPELRDDIKAAWQASAKALRSRIGDAALADWMERSANSEFDVYGDFKEISKSIREKLEAQND